MSIEPPEEGDNLRTASLMAQITNMSGRSLPDKKMVQPSDFYGKPKPPPKPQSAAEQIAFMRSLKGSK